ncbi:E3 ubiquitin-protein ligase RNF139 [Hydra vulgaris]|uniref:E3 ubiquitin-protein ligase RNF139 n=1 Tax=Hydra vulgaris TaxID=6087 RepID=UPI001F5E507B|nr:E3 ubiquitin-protein ligase RNF139-like [Hydra vulgaris]XP_047128972.1 E3 ubiquitin-protein ligase RNF139-like [Hydra vulgaris]
MSYKLLEVFLRVPIIFFLDYSLSFAHAVFPFSWLMSLIFQILAITVCCCILISSASQLYCVYHFGIFFLHLFAVLYLNICSTPITLTTLLTSNVLPKHIDTYIPTFAASWIIYIIFNLLYAISFRSIKPLVVAFALIPVIEEQVYHKNETIPVLTCCSFGLLIYTVLQTCYCFLTQFVELVTYQIQVITLRFRIYGPFVLFFLHWRRLRMHAVLSLFWFIIWNYQLIVFTIFIDEPFDFSFILACSAYSCNSFIKILSLCHILQHVVKVILKGVQRCIADNHTFVEDTLHRPNGLRESVGFLFLSLYTNLTNVDPSKRIVLMQLIILILISALVRSVFEIIEPYLLSLNGGSVVHSKKRHISLVTACLLLIFVSLYLGYLLYNLRERLPFSIPNLITVAQITSALILYFLYMYDARTGESWEQLDDYVYFIKGGCRSFEFILIVLILGYRILDTTSKWTIFQIIMVVLHLYINVYLSLKDGWHSLQLRHLVNKKLNILPQASSLRLEAEGEVCPICLDKMTSARVTPCNHLFHFFCLKKWLNVQNKCPMCHATILHSSA